jgi:hypothetical protein
LSPVRTTESATGPTTAPAVNRRRAVRSWLLWTAGFLVFPVAGLVGTAAAGRVDSPGAAAVGGLVAGAALGTGQALLSSRRLPVLRWTVATAIGMAAGLLLGAHTVQYGTTLGELVLMGVLTGAVLGPSQALVLPRRVRHRWLWAASMPAVWAAGWAVTTVVISDAVEAQFTLLGASGAIVVSAVLGALLHALLPPARKTTSPSPRPQTVSRSAATTGDPS